MNLLQNETISEDPEQLPPARRRRARRLLAPVDADERAAVTDKMARRASPSFDFFLFSLIAGLIYASGLLLDAPGLLLLGAIFSPLMAPVVGLSLGTIVGSARHFSLSLVGLLIGACLVFLAGAAGGWLSLTWMPSGLLMASYHAQLSWTYFAVLVAGALLTAASMTHNMHRPALPSAALSYALYLPVCIAGFGVGSGQPHLFPDGLVIFTLHLAWGAFIGALTLAIVGFRPMTFFGYTFGGVITLLGVLLLIALSSAGTVMETQLALPTQIPSATPSITPTSTSTSTPIPPSETPTPSLTPTLTQTPTLTPTLTPTPVYALIDTIGDTGALLREEPGGKVLRSYFEGTLMQVLPEIQILNGVTWVRVIAPDGLEGWIVQNLLTAATPAPNW